MTHGSSDERAACFVPGRWVFAQRCADGERRGAATVTSYDLGARELGTGMTWALWLAVPVGATTLAALWAWVRGWWSRRADRPLSTDEAMRAHSEYLDALVIPARSTARPPARTEGADRTD
jgi:hypothetical protein